MRVLLLANHLNYGGITSYILNLASALHNGLGCEIYVASRGGAGVNVLQKTGIKHILIPLTTKCEASPKVILSFFKLAKVVRDENIEVIHANTRVTQVLATFLSWSTGRPFVSTCHGYFKPRLCRRLFPCWGRRVIVISEQVREHLVKDFALCENETVLIYNGVDLEKFHPRAPIEIEAEKKRLGLSLDKLVVGHIGRLSVVKGQEFLILAAQLLARQRKDIQFLIIGDGGLKNDLSRLIRQKGLEDVVFLRPGTSDTSLALAVMDVFVMPSLQEGLGLSILEAQAQGIAVAAANVGGIPAVISDGVTGILFPAGDEASLAKAVWRILEDENLKKDIVSAARLQIQERFSLSLMARKTFAVYKSVL